MIVVSDSDDCRIELQASEATYHIDTIFKKMKDKHITIQNKVFTSKDWCSVLVHFYPRKIYSKNLKISKTALPHSK